MNTKPECPFCLENHLLKGDVVADISDAFMIRAQSNPGCYLIIPKVHAETAEELPDTWWQSVKALIPLVPELPSDYNLSFNIGTVAGQTVRHLHLWVIPRETGQTASNMGLASLIYKVNQIA